MTFDDAVQFVLEREGGYVNDPADPGGETKYGISKRNHPTLDIAALTVEEAKSIYHTEYWTAAGCDALPEPLNAVVFDTAVNMGVARAKMLAVAYPDWQDYLWQRADAYREIIAHRPASLKFLGGWIRRLVLLHRFAKEG